MKMAKRMMATLLCLAMLLSGFALADEEIDPAQGQEQIEDETTPDVGGGNSKPEVTNEDVEDEEDESDTVTTPGSVDDSTKDSTGDPTNDSTGDPTNDSTGDPTNDSTGDPTKDSTGDPTKDSTGDPTNDSTSDPTSETDPDADPNDSEQGKEGENQEFSLLSLEGVPLDESDDSGTCEHKNGEQVEWDEPTGKVEYLDEDKHTVYFKHHLTLTCLDCGAVLDRDVTEISKTFDHNLTVSGSVFTCDECGYSFECDHGNGAYLKEETITMPASSNPGVSNVVGSDENGHTIKIHEYTQKYCQKCDYRGEKVPVEEAGGVNKTKTYPHEWVKESGGKMVCQVCGKTNECQHDELEQVDTREDVDHVTKITGDEHTVVYVLTGDLKCKKCGLIVERDVELDHRTETGEHSFDERDDHEIACLVCGYVIPCSHPYVEFLVKKDEAYKFPKDVDAQNHKVYRYDVTYYRCRDCGKEWGWDYRDDAEVTEPHQWNSKGVCDICGRKNECTAHVLEAVVPSETRDENIACKYKDASTHDVTLGIYQKKKCTICGYIEEVLIETLEYPESHYWSADGRCEVCGAEGFCKHPAEYVEKIPGTVSRDDLEPIESGEKTHTIYVDLDEIYHCKRCEAWWGYRVTKYGVERELPHEWDTNNGSYCVICGYENKCTHEDYEEYEDEDYRLIPSMTTATTHSINPFGVVGKRCNNCGADFERRATGSTDTIVTEPHKFVHQGGKTVCEVCGYIKPEKKAESSEKTETPEEIAFEEIAEGTVVHGATVGEPTRMGVTMVQAMAGIVAEYGAGTVVEIQNIDKVLTADECAALNALPPTERILVALSAIGYGDEVKNAIAELQLTLSEEARVLSLKVNTRVALMDDAAKAALQKAIEQYFPNANGVAITLEIRKPGETGVRLERYGFTPSNGEWVFAKLEVANA